MTKKEYRNKQLLDFYSVASHYHDKDIACLKGYFQEGDSKPIFTKIFKGLTRSGFNTLGDVLRATQDDLIKVRNFGSGCRSLLYILLERIQDDPGRLSEYPDIEQNLPKTKITNRKEEIKARLREMGMIV